MPISSPHVMEFVHKWFNDPCSPLCWCFRPIGPTYWFNDPITTDIDFKNYYFFFQKILSMQLQKLSAQLVSLTKWSWFKSQPWVWNKLYWKKNTHLNGKIFHSASKFINGPLAFLYPLWTQNIHHLFWIFCAILTNFNFGRKTNTFSLQDSL